MNKSSVCKYSVIRYVPDELREEFINIGLLFHSPEYRHIDIKFTSNFKRVAAFDDEIDVKFLKVVLEGIKESFTKSTVSGPSEEALADVNFIEKSTFYYANQIQFSNPNLIHSSDYEQDFEDLFRTYVYFDSRKKTRITDDEVKILMNKILRTHEVYKKVNRNYKLDVGTEEIELDYVYRTIDNKLKIIKTFSFDYAKSKSSQATTVAKEWHYNFEKIIKQRYFDHFGIEKDQIDLVSFVYTGAHPNQNIKTALLILEELTKTVQGRKEEEILDFADNMTKDLDTSKLSLIQ